MKTLNLFVQQMPCLAWGVIVLGISIVLLSPRLVLHSSLSQSFLSVGGPSTFNDAIVFDETAALRWLAGLCLLGVCAILSGTHLLVLAKRS